MFQLTENEVEIKVSHFAIPSKKHLGGTLPFSKQENKPPRKPIGYKTNEPNSN